MPSPANPEFLRRAITLATENVVSGAGGPFGAVIVRDGRILGEGVNTVTAAHDPTAHGEVNAIRAACKALGTFSLAGCELYNSLTGTGGTTSSATSDPSSAKSRRSRR